MGEKFPNYKAVTDEKIYIGDYDLQGFYQDLEYAKKSLSGQKGKRYHLCYHKLLNYVVPYTMQAAVTIISDFEDGVINNLYDFDASYKMRDIHVAVFPLHTKSVVMLFIEDGDKRYRKFYRQLGKLLAISTS